MKKEVEVVCAVIKKENNYFICQRGPKGEVGYKWEFPGGKIEEGETHEEALIREIKEELKTDIHVLDYVQTVHHEYNTFILTMHAYLCNVISGDLELSEHLDKAWVSVEDFINYDFAEADKPIVRKISCD